MSDAMERIGEEILRKQVLAGGYRIVDWRTAAPEPPRSHLVHLVASGAVVPEAIEAAAQLRRRGVPANVLNLTSARRLYEAWRLFTAGSQPARTPSPGSYPQDERHAPIITVLDGASHALAWLGSVYGMRTFPLGVDSFGQSGARSDLYRHYRIDTQSIVDSALGSLERSGIAL